MGYPIKKHYALIDDQGKVIQTIHTRDKLTAPWIHVNQPFVTGSMVFDPADGIFKNPAEGSGPV